MLRAGDLDLVVGRLAGSADRADMISIWPRSLLDADGEGLIALSAEHVFERSQVGLFRRRNALLSPAAQAMVEALHAASAPHGALASAEGG